MYTYDFFELMVLAIVFMAILLIIFFIYTGSLTLAHSRNSQMSFMYGFFFVKFLFLTVVCVVIMI